MKKKAAASPTLAEDAVLWASALGSAVSGVSAAVAIVEGIENRRVVRQAAAAKVAGKVVGKARSRAGVGRNGKPGKKGRA